MNKKLSFGATLIASVLATVFISGCSKPPGQAYVGTWTDEKHQANFSVERNGETFLIKVQPLKPDGSPAPGGRTVPATIENGALKSDGGMFASTMTYVEKNDTVISTNMGGTVTLSRVK